MSCYRTSSTRIVTTIPRSCDVRPLSRSKPARTKGILAEGVDSRSAEYPARNGIRADAVA